MLSDVIVSYFILKMKKFIFTLIFIFFTLTTYSQNVGTIASFNTLHLGWGKKDYSKVAKVLSHFDIIGLQEVMNLNGIVSLVNALNTGTPFIWKYHISRYSVGKNRYKEYYGYVWKVNRVKIIRSLGYYREKNPDDFMREPYGVIFKINNFDFTFVICHIIFGNSIYQRRNEVNKLNDVYNYFQMINGREQDVIIAGDFNLPANDYSFYNLFNHADNIKYTIGPSEKTTVGKYMLKSSYDNFFYSTTFTKELQYGFVYKYSNEYMSIKKNISDHLPIYIMVYTGKDDD